jgi:hypothetical protein
MVDLLLANCHGTFVNYGDLVRVIQGIKADLAFISKFYLCANESVIKIQMIKNMSCLIYVITKFYKSIVLITFKQKISA